MHYPPRGGTLPSRSRPRRWLTALRHRRPGTVAGLSSPAGERPLPARRCSCSIACCRGRPPQDVDVDEHGIHRVRGFPGVSHHRPSRCTPEIARRSDGDHVQPAGDRDPVRLLDNHPVGLSAAVGAGTAVGHHEAVPGLCTQRVDGIVQRRDGRWVRLRSGGLEPAHPHSAHPQSDTATMAAKSPDTRRLCSPGLLDLTTQIMPRDVPATASRDLRHPRRTGPWRPARGDRPVDLEWRKQAAPIGRRNHEHRRESTEYAVSSHVQADGPVDRRRMGRDRGTT